MDLMSGEKGRRSSLDGVLFLALILAGGFHEYISCMLSILLSVMLLVRMHRNGKLIIRKDLLTSAVIAVCLGYGLSCLWAVDRGMAFIGFMKFLPVGLYLIYLQQQDRVADTLMILPWFGVVTVVITGVGMQFPVGEALFSVAGRLAGFFQYPNTYAVFLLVCELLMLKKEDRMLWDYIALIILSVGFLYTGSRTAFAVAVLANVAMLFVLGKRPVRIALLVGVIGVVLLAGLLALDKNSVIHRYLTISFKESTFVGRLLYWQDALPLLLEYPFGMGYMGYYYVQQSIQTGVYSVVYVHNDLLQMLLDIGWVPVALVLTTLVQWGRRKDVPLADKLIAGAVCVHSFFDFDLQFIGMVFLLVLLLSGTKAEKTMEVRPSAFHKLGLAVVMCVCLYMGAALSFAHWGMHGLSDRLYPYNTQNKLQMLEQTDDLDEAKKLADEILAQNTCFYYPYSIQARYHYSRGDVGAMIDNGRATLERNPFAHEEYEMYCKMLINCIDLYTKAGDMESAMICRQELLDTAEALSDNEEQLSALGKLIDDQPVLELSAEVEGYIRQEGRGQ